MAFGLAALTASTSCDAEQLVAFPGAEGFGAFSMGGRGGRVIEVTNLGDIDPATGRALPGSLRAAIEATGPRIVVFRVSGTIDVCQRDTSLVITSPYITIAGHTAPGDGITVRLDPSCSGSALKIWTHDVILRHIRFRPGSNPTADGGASDAISANGVDAHDIIIDHCSFSWATDENVDISWGAHDVTLQHSIVAEGLKNAPRAVGVPSGGYGMLIADGDSNVTNRISVHHNLFAHNWYRNPQVSAAGLIDYRNNVVYDWGLHGVRLLDIYGPTQINLVGNYAKAGPSTSSVTSLREMWAYRSIGVTPFSYYVSDNIGPRRPSPSAPETDIIFCREHDDAIPNSGVDCDPVRFAVATPFRVPRITTSAATSVYDEVLQNAGATLPRRDAVDARIVSQVRSGSGGTVSNPADVGGWPRMVSLTPPPDADHDGMPDAWELQYGFDRNRASDGALDADVDGYTNVEEFLNSTDPFWVDHFEAPEPGAILATTVALAALAWLRCSRRRA